MSAGGSEGDIRVAVEAAGVDEALEGIDQTEEKLNEAGESMGETSDQMQDMSRRMKGLGQALAASLAVASAGLLAQVPVLGEAMGGLSAIVSALAYQMDGVLRPVVEPAADWFYDLSAAIFELDGAAGTAVGAVGVLASALGVLTGAAASLGFLQGGLPGALASVKGLFVTLGSAIKTASVAIGGFVSGSLAAAAALGAGIGVLGAWVLHVTGALDAIQNFGAWVRNTLPGWVSDGMAAVLSATIAGPLSVLGAFIIGVFEDGFSGGVDRAQEAFNTLLGSWRRTWGHIKGLAVDVLDEILDALEEIVGQTWNTIVEIQGKLTGGFDPDLNPFSSGNADLGDLNPFGGGGGGGGGSSGFAANRRNDPLGVSMDGRSLTQQDSRYRRDGTAQRNRNG